LSYEIRWSNYADSQLDRIYGFLKDSTSERVAKRYISKILKKPNSLSDNPFLGAKEPDLAELSNNYRYLVWKHYKIIYRVDSKNEIIRVLDVFDTRQHPNKLLRKKD
jgi:plasmid stabilization system protein ParE